MAAHNYPKGWARTRAIILKRDNHTCHRCGQPATTVDHLTPIATAKAQGWPEHQIHAADNLAACCTTCNSSMGGTLGRSKQRTKESHQTPTPIASQTPSQALQAPFFDTDRLPPTKHGEIPPEGDGAAEPVRVLGAVEPRVHSPLLGGTSLFDDMHAWLVEHVDRSFWPEGSESPLLPWQAWLLRDALTVDGSGDFLRRLVLTVVARQQGKTHMVRLLIVWLLCTRPGFHIVGTAQKLALARQTWEDVVEVFEFSPKLADRIKSRRLTNGQESIMIDNRSKYSIIAATRRARGFTAHMLFVDELREITPDAWAAIQPFLTTTGGQLWATSNAGDLTSEVLNEVRANLLAYPSHTSAIYEWSAHEKLALTDRAGWRQASPAMGYMRHVNYDMLENALRTSTSANAFRAERLCQFVLSLSPAIPMDDYEECGTEFPLAPTGDPCWFAIDATPDSKRADLLVSIQSGDKIRVFPLASWTHENAVDDLTVATEIGHLAAVWRPRAIGFNKNATPGVGMQLQMRGHPVQNVTGNDFAQACDVLLAAVVHKRIEHPNHPEMLTHFAHAVAKPLGDGGWRLVRRESGGYISIACAAAIAVGLASAPRSIPLIMSA